MTPQLHHHLLACVALFSGPLAAQFHDDFTAKKLDKAWTWSDPGNDASFTLGTPTGRLRMIVPPGNDHTTGHGPPLYAGPMLTIKASGDFTITTHVAVNYPAVPAAKESGLMIWKDQSNNLQFKRTNAFNSQNVLFYGNLAKTNTSFHGNVRVAANELYLRIERSGSTFTSFYSTDGVAWTKVGSVTWNVTGTLNVGIATSYWLWFGASTLPATGDYMFFDLRTPKDSLMSNRAGVSTALGGTISLSLDRGKARAGNSYLVVGSLSGSRPGFVVHGGGRLPLNWDALSELMYGNQNLKGFFPGTAGKLDANGRASAKFIVPAKVAAVLVGVSLTFAGVSFANPSAALSPTNAVGVAFAK